MENKPSLFLLLAAIVGLVYVGTSRVTSPAPSAPSESKPPQPSPPQTPPAPPPSQTWNRQCGVAPPPLQGLCTAVYDPLASPEPPADWRGLPWVAKVAADARHMIVLVSDPVETGDSLRFDRAVESVYSAARAAGYTLQDQWTPWPALLVRERLHPEAWKTEQTPNDQPGVLVFRRPGPEWLLVYLVGESPISGVRRVQFLNAMHYLSALSRDGALQRVAVAGPNFSGSFDSLAEVLDASALASDGRAKSFRVISASATSGSRGMSFRNHRGAAIIQYHSMVHDDGYAADRFLDYASRRWNIPSERHAVLSESMSSFGQSLRQLKMARSLSVVFPRGLFRLRNAYPETRARDLFAPQGASPAASERLSVTLKGGGFARDSVPSLAQEQTAVMQESLLLGIASALHQQRIVLARVEATDTFDAVFVAGFLRQAYPAVRVYFGNSDLLFSRASERLPLEGSLSVTTYPLIPRNQIWVHGDARLSPMSSRYEAGLFNAITALLNRTDLLEHSFPAQGYAGRPPLWLTIVGTNGYWPIALLDLDATEPDPVQFSATSPGGAPAPPVWPDPGSPTLLWFIAFGALWLASLTFAVMVLLAQILHPPPRFLQLWAILPGERGAMRRTYFASGQCLLAAAMLAILAGPVWNLALHQGPAWSVRVSISSVLAACVALAAALAPVFVSNPGGPRPWRERWVSPLLLAVFVLFVVAWWRAITSGDRLEGFFLSYRSLDLLNGVSPVLPFLLLATAYLVLAFLHQQRDRLALRIPKHLPRLGPQEPAACLALALDKVREPLCSMVLSHQGLAWLIVAAGASVILFFPLHGAQSLESGVYDNLFRVFFTILYLLLVATWARFLLVWLRLKPALDRLAQHPVHSAFAAYRSLPTLLGGSSISVDTVISDSLHILHACRETPSLKAALADLESKTTRCFDLEAPPPPAQLSGIQESLAGIGTRIAAALEPLWDQGRAAALLLSGKAPAEPDKTSPPDVRLGERFIAIQYAGFLANVMLQLRNLLLFVIVAYVLGMISPLVYPFRSQHELAWTGTFAFVLLGLPVLWVIVQAERHPVLRGEAAHSARAITGSALRFTFYLAAPLLTLVAAHFPELGRHLLSLVQPAMQAAR